MTVPLKYTIYQFIINVKLNMESNLICFFYHKKNVFIIKIKVVKEVFDSTFINFK